MWRRRTLSYIRSAILIFVCIFIWLQLLILGVSSPHLTTSRTGDASTSSTDRSYQLFNEFLHQEQEESASLGHREAAPAPSPSANKLPTNGSVPSPSQDGGLQLFIRQRIKEANEALVIRNEDTLGPVGIETPVLAIQVHTRIQYLRYLIQSLTKVRGIQSTLLVFSHDVYDEEINSVVREITFAKVMQIFYPYSIQLHPHSFPGQDPNDCPAGITKAKAVQMRCNNADHPDIYGHYREAKFTQIKHHWWWKVHFIMDEVLAAYNHSGPVVFLEEDHYVVPDVLHMLRALLIARSQHCQLCNVLGLGAYLKHLNFGSDGGRAEVWPWVASKHNMGMVLFHETWHEIKKCSAKFCTYDDYNWDWSLQHISQSCLKQRLTVMTVKAPRVFHIGECGVHHKLQNCSGYAELGKIERAIQRAAPYFFPTKLTLTRSTKRIAKIPKGNGGWGDARDQWLCMHIANTTSGYT